MTAPIPLRHRPAATLASLLLCVLCGLPGDSHAEENRIPAPVAQALAQAAIPPSSVAIFVQEVGSSRSRLEVNAARPMNPASLMKLVTTYAALDLLGPAFTWKTAAYANGMMQGTNGELLDGDLVLKGGGDPKFTIENLWLFVRALRSRGLREIRGDLVLDRSYFEASDNDPSQFDAEPLRPYNVGPDALLVNFKSFRFSFVPDVERRTVAVIAEPRPASLALANGLKGVDGPCVDWKERLRAEFQSNGDTARAAFAGVYALACGERHWHVSLLSHPGYVAGAFRQLWEEAGGILRGGAREGSVAPNARLLFSAESPQLAEIVRDINKYSNNVMARQLYLTLSAEMLRQPGAAARSAKVIETWLGQRGLDFPELVIENGSGLSRAERISARHLGELLLSAFGSAVMPEFVASLPLVANDGTMRKRLNEKNVAGQAHVKTGSLEGVKAVAGYVLGKNGKRHVVVFVVNHPNAANGQAAQDALLQWVHGAG